MSKIERQYKIAEIYTFILIFVSVAVGIIFGASNSEYELPENAQKVWDRLHSTEYGRDICGALIKKSAYYGNEAERLSPYVWNIDHIFPVSKGGTDELSNLQPLHKANNDAKADHIYKFEWDCQRTDLDD